MLEKFEIGKEYVFRKELYLTFKQENDEIYAWVDKINGKKVNVKDAYFGVAGKREYNIIPAWCEEV